MCKTKQGILNSNLISFPLGLAAVAALLLGSAQSLAHQSPSGCNANNLTINISKDHNNVTNGTVVTFGVTVENPAAGGSCDITLGAAGLVFTCPGADGSASGTQTVLIPGGTVIAAGTPQASFTIPCTINVTTAATAAQAKVDAPGAVLHDNTIQDDPANINKTISVNVFRPCIDVTKECDGAPFAIGTPIKIKGVVTNCGDVLLQNVTVVDDHAGTLLGPITLAPGASAPYTGQYTPTGNPCGPFTDTVTATGVAPLDTPVTVTDTASATCPIITAPCIDVTKACPATVVLGSPVTFSGSVSNCGNVLLTNVIVRDSVLGVVFGPVDLAPHTAQTYSGSHTVTVCGPFTDTVTASGADACTGATVMDTASCTTTVLCPPHINVDKQVACVPSGGNCEGAGVIYGETATGVAGAGFCYKITVVNDGVDVLNNVNVSDPDIPGVAGSFPSTFAIGQSETRFFKKTWPAGTHVNTVTANGVGASTGISTNDTDTATAIVVPISVSCAITLFSQFDGDGNPNDNHVTLTGSGPVDFSLTVNNTGQANLSVAIVGLPCSVDLNGNPIPNTLTIPVGGSSNFVCRVAVVCPQGTNITVTVTGTAVASATVPCVFDANGNAITTAPSSCSASVTALCPPHINVEKQVACVPSGGNCEAAGVTYGESATGVTGAGFCYKITVVNDSADVLNNVTVSDPDIPGVAGSFPSTFAIGQSETRFFKKTWPAGTHVNTVTANGVGASTGISTNDTDTATAIVVPISVSCAITLFSQFDGDGNPNDNHVTLTGSGPVDFSLTVNNTGQADLSVAIVGLPCSVDLNGNPIPNTLTIPAGGSSNFVCRVAVVCPQGTNITVTVTGTAVASATVPCVFDANGNAITTAPSSCSASVTTLCPPHINVDKQVACVPSGGDCAAAGVTYGESASGVTGAGFCYKITVVNDGADVLNNVTVSDPDIPGVAGSFPSTFAIGQTETRFFKKTWPAGTHVNTVTANGVGASTGIRTNDTDTATAIVVPISVSCAITLFSQFDDDGNPNDNHVTLLDSGPVDFSLTVNNTGQAALSVAIVGLPCSVDLDGNPIPTTLTIPAGGSSNFVCSVEVLCPQGTNITVTVTGTAVASATVPCVFDANGNAITTAPSSCTASVNCAQPVTCRVTGGGVLIDGTVDNSCIDVPTTISPLVVNGLTVNKITHGGQLGAPFSQMDCGAILGNPCIRGQWQHTRHYQGKGNPRDVIDMNFHSVTPKGQFDSLSCACLGCCDPATGAFIPPSVGPLIHKFALCNPDDHKVCGPQPRPSPANAIIFSGVGKLTPTSDNGVDASKEEWVVFRVYIEDRSEPGGFHPKGAVEPADIYCFQAWKTGIKTSKKPDFSTISAAFRTALGQANCDFLNSLESGALPIGSLPSPTVDGVTADIQDCGPMNTGNHQIHPSTGATCDQ